MMKKMMMLFVLFLLVLSMFAHDIEEGGI